MEGTISSGSSCAFTVAYEHGSIDAIPLDVVGNRACVVIGGDSGKEAGGEMGTRHVSSVCTVPLEKQSQITLRDRDAGARSRSSRPFRYVSKKNGSPSCRLVRSYYLLDYTWQLYGLPENNLCTFLSKIGGWALTRVPPYIRRTAKNRGWALTRDRAFTRCTTVYVIAWLAVVFWINSTSNCTRRSRVQFTALRVLNTTAMPCYHRLIL